MQKQHKTGNFVQKLEKLLKSQAFSDTIAWDSSKTSIDVLNIARMENEILPSYFRHQKFESFVRQLNLYGFRKIKHEGRQRFTHPLLLNGQQLSAITSFKCMKINKGSKQTVQSPAQLQNRLLEPQVNQVLLSSMENTRQMPILGQRKDIFLQQEPTGAQKLPENTIFMIPANYLPLWNFMQFTGGQNLPNLSIVAPVMPQQLNNSGFFAY